MLPTFIVIGAQKAGTSSLWEYLSGHPDVFVAREKEPKFFVEERGLGLGLAWYESLFDSAGRANARGEFSTDYTAFPLYDGVPARIASLVPEARLIYLMRDPIARIRSAYAYGLWVGAEHRPINDAVLYDARYLYQSQYALQIEQYLEHFPLSQLLLITAEDLRDRREETVKRVFSFIGADAAWVPPNIDVTFNSSEGRTKPRAWARLVGDALVRSRLETRIPRSLQPSLERLSNHDRVRAPISQAELQLDEDIVDRLSRYLRKDLESLRQWMGPSFDCWGLLRPDRPRIPAKGAVLADSESTGASRAQ